MICLDTTRCHMVPYESGSKPLRAPNLNPKKRGEKLFQTSHPFKRQRKETTQLQKISQQPLINILNIYKYHTYKSTKHLVVILLHPFKLLKSSSQPIDSRHGHLFGQAIQHIARSVVAAVGFQELGLGERFLVLGCFRFWDALVGFGFGFGFWFWVLALACPLAFAKSSWKSWREKAGPKNNALGAWWVARFSDARLCNVFSI